MQYGLIGEHLKHSYSKIIHEKIADYTYSLCELSPDELSGFMKNREFCGINVTIPYKQAVIPMLDFVSPEVLKIGAVNTVVNRGGRLFGYNTDFDGMRKMLLRAGADLSGKKVLILGSGGTSKTARAVAKNLGARQILQVSRRQGEGVVTYEEVLAKHTDAQFIINTTPVGMFPSAGGTPLDISSFDMLEGVFDAVYNPLCTDLVLDARAKGITAQGGLYMLVAQAVFACSHFTRNKIDDEIIEICCNNLLESKQNVVLAGMPSSGKSTVGRLLAGALNRTFIDTDDEIIKKINMPIAEFFVIHGEDAFRDIESEVIADISKQTGVVIASGGGAVLRQENVRAFKRNGKVVFLSRGLESLAVTDDRPLSSSRDALAEMYEARLPIYTAAADFTVENDTTAQAACDKILKELF